MIRHPPTWCDHPGCGVCFGRQQAMSDRAPIKGTYTDLDLRAREAEAQENDSRMRRYDRQP